MISIIDDAGHERFLGNIIPMMNAQSTDWTVYGDVPETPLIRKQDWDQYLRDPWVDPFECDRHDQDGIGMCNASATVLGLERGRKRQGLGYTKLSGGYLYGKINGGSDRGSLLEDGLRESMKGGTCSVNVVPYLNWRSRPSEAQEEGKLFRLSEAYLCPTFDHIMSAIICGFDAIIGIMWYGNYKTDSDGWLPIDGRGGGGGHALLSFCPCKRGSMYGLGTYNSWGTRWGRNGVCVIPETAFRGPVGGWWAIRSVRDEGGIIPAPVN